MSHKGPGLHFPEVTGHWDTQPRPRASPKPPYLAVKPSGEAEQARTGLAAGAGEGAPAGAAPGPDAVGAAAQGPLVAGGGGGRPEEGAPQSGAGGGRESCSEALAESPHLPHSLVEPVVFLQRNLGRSPRRTCGEWPGRPPITHSHQTNLPPPRGRESDCQAKNPRLPYDPLPKSHRGRVEEEAPQLGVGPRVLGPEEGSRRGRAGGCSRRALRGAWRGRGSTLGLGLPGGCRGPHSTLRLGLRWAELELTGRDTGEGWSPQTPPPLQRDQNHSVLYTHPHPLRGPVLTRFCEGLAWSSRMGPSPGGACWAPICVGREGAGQWLGGESPC